MRDVIIRPLLCVSRGEIEKYLQEKGISWRTDETNLTDAYTRNKIRNHVLPYIEENINPGAGQHIQEMAGLLKDISDYIDRQGSQGFDTCVTVGKDSSCAIHSDTFRQLDVVIQREIIRRAIGVAAGKLKDVEQEHVEMIRGLLDKACGAEMPSALSNPGSPHL